MKTTWRYKDLIDLEYFFHVDEPVDESARKNAERRDREIYIRHILPRLAPGTSAPRRWIIREWLERRRASLKYEAPEALLPGEAYDEMYRLLALAAIIFGVMSGGGLAFSLLRYAGTRPVNVSVYLSLLVGTQLLLIVLLAVGALVRLLFRRKPPFSLLYALFSSLLVTLMLRIKRRTARRMSGRGRSSLEAIFGLIRGKRRIYGTLFYWPFFTLAQVFGISFNAGVLGATLLRVLGTDIAFGWQSSILFSAEMVYEAAKTIALPWSWLLPPGIAHPTLAQIEGSHMILKDGIYHLATQDLVSWWPFLCLAVLFYGLIPRLLLFAACILFKSRALTGLDFSHSRSDQLVHRMETPRLDTEGETLPERLEDSSAPAIAPTAPLKEADGAPPDRRLVALIPDDIFEECPRDELEALTWKVFGFRIREAVRMGDDDTADGALPARLAKAAHENGRADFFILKEAWQPPIREDLAFIRELRQAVGDRSRIQMGLIGKPSPETIFTRVAEEDWNIWHQKIASLGDPYLRLERLVKHES